MAARKPWRGWSSVTRPPSSLSSERSSIPEGVGVGEQAARGRRILPAHREALGNDAQAEAGGMRVEQDGLDPGTYTDFIRLGMTHVLAISGMHVALYVGGALLLLRRSGMPRETALLIVLCLVPPYVLLTGSSPSAHRAVTGATAATTSSPCDAGWTEPANQRSLPEVQIHGPVGPTTTARTTSVTAVAMTSVAQASARPEMPPLTPPGW